MKRSTLASLVAGVFITTGCEWLALGKNALTYKTIQAGEAANIAVLDSLVYATLADSGIRIVDARTGHPLATIPPPPGSESVDDLAISEGFLFALDARAPGHLSVLSLRDPLNPVPASPPREVPVGPFSGVSAGAGFLVVSGGTSAMTAWRFDSAGVVEGPTAVSDLGRGQPDVLVAGDRTIAFVSTHYWGPYFGLEIVRYDDNVGRFEKLGKLELNGAGFTEGGAKPANFPIEAAVLDESTVLVAFARGLAVVDIANPATPKLKRVIDLAGPGISVDATQGMAAIVVGGERATIVLLDVTSGRARIVRRITLPPGTNPLAVAFSMRTVVVSARDRGILVFDR